MKLQLHLSSVIGSFVFLAQPFLGIPLEATPPPNSALLQTSEELYIYTSDTAKDIRTTVEHILSIPQEEQTFDNTLKIWNQLTEKLSEDYYRLQSSLASSHFESLPNQYLLFAQEVLNHSELRSALTHFATNALNEKPLDPFQRHMMQRFLANDAHTTPKALVYLKGAAEESIGTLKDFTVLNLNVGALEQTQAYDLGQNTLAKDADILSLQEISSQEKVYIFYQELKEQYPHFYLIEHSDPIFPIRNNNLLIASKYPLENVQYHLLPNQENNGFLDFVLTTQETSFGHVYLTHLQKEQSEKERITQLEYIVEKMEHDFLTQGNIPFFLAGDLGINQEAQEPAENLINTYFQSTKNKKGSYASLLQTLPSYPYTTIDPEYTLKAVVLTDLENHSGILSLIKKSEISYVDFFLKNASGLHLPENAIILCKRDGDNDNRDDRDDRGRGSYGFSAGKDDQGNIRGEGHLRYSREDDNDKSSRYGLEVQVHVDPEGKFSSGIKGTADWEF